VKTPRARSFLSEVFRKFHQNRRDRRRQILADLSPGIRKATVWIKQMLYSFKDRRYGYCVIDGNTFPEGFPPKEDVNNDDVECKRHVGNQCYCIGFFCQYEKVLIFTDWKPFALGKHEGLEKGEECEIHGGKKCFCWIQSAGSEQKDFCVYDFKTKQLRNI